ncbi:MAG TPA: Mur ligase family protein, partial [Miltoncostaeaceae bacterium]|nr:Mur ligase family protein [Miltoncostaeaceae bacterium]
VEGAFADSRVPLPHALFVGLPGEVHDGGDHAPAALRAGAAAALVGEDAAARIAGDLPPGATVIAADDPLAVLQAAGREALARLGARVVGITGSVGKTTTKDILVAMLRVAGARAHGTPGNRNTEVGVPLSLLGLPPDTEIAVVEMGMRGPGQIGELATLAPPDVACITAVAPVHLELLGTLEAIAAAKAEILGGLRPGGTAVVPADAPLLEPHLAALPAGVRVVTFAPDLDGRVDLALGKGWQRRNASAALACCEALGHVPPPGARVDVVLSAMRGQERPLPGGGVLIVDCYNANPVAMHAALDDLAGRAGRRVAVLGDMMELGPEEMRYHREVGAHARDRGVDLIVAVGARARGYLEGAEGVAHAWFPDGAAAAEGVGALLAPGDVVLVKASRSVALERVADALAPA